jgi:hypothetical protein
MANTNRPLPALTDNSTPHSATPGGACACCSVSFVSLPGYPAFVRSAEWVCVGCAESIDEGQA